MLDRLTMKVREQIYNNKISKHLTTFSKYANTKHITQTLFISSSSVLIEYRQRYQTNVNLQYQLHITPQRPFSVKLNIQNDCNFSLQLMFFMEDQVWWKKNKWWTFYTKLYWNFSLYTRQFFTNVYQISDNS